MGAGRGRGSLTAAAARYSIDGWVTPCKLADFAERSKGEVSPWPEFLRSPKIVGLAWIQPVNRKLRKIPAQAYLIYLDEKCVNAFRALERCLAYLGNMKQYLEEMKADNYRDRLIPFGDS